MSCDPSPNFVPGHVAIIMDGNGRWAQERGMPRIEGHRQGARVVREIITAAAQWGVGTLTLYSFSTENWKRPKEEVSALMNLLGLYLKHERNLMIKKGIRLKAIGRRSDLPEAVLRLLEDVEKETCSGQKMTLQLALSYGGRQEIMEAAQRLIDEGVQEVTQGAFESKLWTCGQSDPEVIIRTSGEQRLSNFLLWQSAYSEFIFNPKYWPDFTIQDFCEAIDQFALRQRRFGGCTVQASAGS